MDAINLFDQYIFDNSDNFSSDSFEEKLASDYGLKSEFVSYLSQLGANFLKSSPKVAIADFVNSRLTENDCSILVKLLQFETKWAYGFERYISEITNSTSDESKLFLFDSYMKGLLSKPARKLFDLCLSNSEDFASNFKVYIFTVDGICREAHQDNLDFGVAMKHLTKDQLKEIVGKGKLGNEGIDSITHKSEHGKTRDIGIAAFTQSEHTKSNWCKTWGWQVASIAAVVIIAFTAVLRVEKNARNSVDNAIYACAEINPDLVRAGGKTIDITALSDEELKAQLPELINHYQSASNPDDVADNGYALAMAYLRLHDRDNAKVILEQLVSRFAGNADYAESVSRWKSILNLLK